MKAGIAVGATLVLLLFLTGCGRFVPNVSSTPTPTTVSKPSTSGLTGEWVADLQWTEQGEDCEFSGSAEFRLTQKGSALKGEARWITYRRDKGNPIFCIIAPIARSVETGEIPWGSLVNVTLSGSHVTFQVLGFIWDGDSTGDTICGKLSWSGIIPKNGTFCLTRKGGGGGGGGGEGPVATPTPTPSGGGERRETPPPPLTASPGRTGEPTRTATPTVLPPLVLTPLHTPTSTPLPTSTRIPTPTPTPTRTPTPTPTSTPTPRPTPTPTPTPTSVPVPKSFRPMGLAIEEGGATALVTTESGLLIRLDLTTLAATRVIAQGLAAPVGVAIEPGGTTALVAESGQNRLIRVDLAGGGVTPVATGMTSPQGVALESGGMTALVTATKQLARVTLATGAVQTITTGLSRPRGVVLEPGGATALVEDEGSRVARVTLGSGLVTVVATSTTSSAGRFAGGLALEATGGTAVATTGTGCLVRLDLAKGEGTTIGCLFSTRATALALEKGGATALLGDETRVVRVYLSAAISVVASQPSSPPATAAQAFDIEAGSGIALLLEHGDYSGIPPKVVLTNLKTGGWTPVALLDARSAGGLAIEPGGRSLLVTTDGTTLVRVNLLNRAVTVLTRLLQNAGRVVVEPGGATALVAAGRDLFRVDLKSGAVTVFAREVQANDVALEAGGATALLTWDYGQSVARLDLKSAAVTTLVTDLYSSYRNRGEVGLTIEEGGRSVLVSQPHEPPEGASTSFSGRVVRVDLVTGAVTVVVPAGLNARTNDVAVEPGGATALVVDQDRLVRITLPPAR